MQNKSVAELSRELESGKISSVELTREFLDRIKAEDGQFNSFISVTEELAMADAKAADEQRAAGNAVPLQLVLEDGSVYGAEGKLAFSEVTVDEGTGSVTLRGTRILAASARVVVWIRPASTAAG